MTLHSEPLPYPAQPAQFFSALVDLPWAMWLDSGGRDRYDILVADPIATLETRAGTTFVHQDGRESASTEDPFQLIRALMGEPILSDTALPFAGGAVGYWGYDLARRWVRLSNKKTATSHLPDMAIGIYDWAIVIDHQQKQAHLVSRLRHPATQEKLPKIIERMQNAAQTPDDFQLQGDIHAVTSQAQYQAAFAKIQQYLKAGDCYQINYAQTFTAHAKGDAYSAYLALRAISPAPFSTFINLPQAQILCTSPERFIKIEQGHVETKPIKGTRPRSVNLDEDDALKQDLLNNTKDRAENLMIVDLLRNDLSKNCKPGSVEVKQLFKVESYANVHHLVSTITGELRPDCDSLTLFKDCFPGGSITGAPKQRAMEIIDELEMQPRELYCGAIGYLGWDGNMDSNIAIRTLIYSDSNVRFSVGGGIVADSKVADEYQETLDKADSILTMLKQYGGRLK